MCIVKMNDLDVESRNECSEFNASKFTRDYKVFFSMDIECPEEYFKLQNEEDKKVFSVSYCYTDEKGDIWMPYFIFVAFIIDVIPSYYVYAFQLAVES